MTSLTGQALDFVVIDEKNSSPNAARALACAVTNKIATLSAIAAGDFFLCSEELAKLSTLNLECKSSGANFFLPILHTGEQLNISLRIEPGQKALLALLFANARRDVSLSLFVKTGGTFNFFSLLQDADTTLTCEAVIERSCQAMFAGLTRAGNGIHSSIELNVRHSAACGRSQQKFYSYAKDKAQIRFCGRITVDHGADGTEAHQLHRGIMLTNDARIDAQPFLNILHDDVRCTHGSTVGYIDEEALRYLQARGIARNDAEQILIDSSEQQFVDLLPQGKIRQFFGFKEEAL